MSQAKRELTDHALTHVALIVAGVLCTWFLMIEPWSSIRDDRYEDANLVRVGALGFGVTGVILVGLGIAGAVALVRKHLARRRRLSA